VAPEDGTATEAGRTAKPEKPAVEAQQPKAGKQGQAGEPAQGGQQTEQQPGSGLPLNNPPKRPGAAI